MKFVTDEAGGIKPARKAKAATRAKGAPAVAKLPAVHPALAEMVQRAVRRSMPRLGC